VLGFVYTNVPGKMSTSISAGLMHVLKPQKKYFQI